MQAKEHFNFKVILEHTVAIYYTIFVCRIQSFNITINSEYTKLATAIISVRNAKLLIDEKSPT